MLPLEQFSINNKCGTLKTYCRECMAEVSRKWYRDNRERARERMSQYNTERNKSRSNSSNPVGRPKREPLKQLARPLPNPVGRPKRGPNELGQMQCYTCQQWLSLDRYSQGTKRCKSCVSAVYYAKQRYCNLSLAEKQRRNEVRRLSRRRGKLQ